MILKYDYSEWELIDALWSGGKKNATQLAEAGKWFDFCDWLDDLIGESEELSLTDVNDMLWFDFDYIKEALGMESEEDDGE